MEDSSTIDRPSSTRTDNSAVYQELHNIALAFMRNEPQGHTLQATGLVHEAWIRMSGHSGEKYARPEDRRRFLSAAATMMRRILVDHARTRATLRRGGDRLRLTSLDVAQQQTDRQDLDVLALDEALQGLARIDAQQARIVEFRFFGGLSLEDIAAELDLSVRTVGREWACAKAWLHRAIAATGADEPSSP
jgi:RNA polymerase sigma-70 factor (ECF subfamily)